MSESKLDNSRTTLLLDKVQEFCISSQLERDFEVFAEEYKHVFMKSTEFKEGQEHPLEFYDIFKDYLKRFERKIENFISKEGFSVEEFYSQCREILDNDEAFGSRRFFIEALLATSEYQYFYTLMIGEMHRLKK